MERPRTNPGAILWYLGADSEPARREVDEPLVLPGVEAWESSVPVVDPVLVPVDAGGPRGGVDGALAALVIAWGQETGELAVNRAPVRAGTHLLHHGDRVEVRGHVFYLAAPSTPQEALYDPAVHGADLFCFRTKARFEPGDPLVVCPGPPSRECGMMVSRSAWDTGLPCHACGWDPAAPEWSPPATAWALAAARSAVEDFRELVRARAQRSCDGEPE